MIAYDRKTFVGSIALTSNMRRSIWASQTSSGQLRSTRTAGYVPTPVSRHELLAFALNSSLRNINRAQYDRLIPVAGTNRPTLLVICADSSFSSAMNSALANLPSTLNVTDERLIRELKGRSTRFDLTFRWASDEPTLNDVRDWAQRHVLGGRLAPDYRGSVYSTTC